MFRSNAFNKVTKKYKKPNARRRTGEKKKSESLDDIPKGVSKHQFPTASHELDMPPGADVHLISANHRRNVADQSFDDD